MNLHSLEPESSASANSATSAYYQIFNNELPIPPHPHIIKFFTMNCQPLPRELAVSDVRFKKRAHRLMCSQWCERRDLNPYESLHTPLKRARLPIPPLSHNGSYFIIMCRKCQYKFEKKFILIKFSFANYPFINDNNQPY